MSLWWGYLHIDGSLILKKAWDSPFFWNGVLDDAEKSDFVFLIADYFPAEDQKDAFEKLKQIIRLANGSNLQ